MQRDASASQAELAEHAGVSPSLVSRRLSRLKETGVLRAVVGLVDAQTAPGSRAPPSFASGCKDHAAANVRAFRDLG